MNGAINNGISGQKNALHVLLRVNLFKCQTNNFVKNSGTKIWKLNLLALINCGVPKFLLTCSTFRP